MEELKEDVTVVTVGDKIEGKAAIENILNSCLGGDGASGANPKVTTLDVLLLVPMAFGKEPPDLERERFWASSADWYRRRLSRSSMSDKTSSLTEVEVEG